MRRHDSCDFCSGLNKTYQCFSLVVYTNQDVYSWGMLAILKKMSQWCIDRMFHLSPSEIILLRPDILQEFLEQNYKDEIIRRWLMSPSWVCLECIKTVKQKVPER